MRKRLVMSANLFTVILISTFSIYTSCMKEYSCEGCKPCYLNTSIDLLDTVWRFNIGNKLFYGSLGYSEFNIDSSMFGFTGYSLHAPGAELDFSISLHPQTFTRNYNNLPVNNVVSFYGVSAGNISEVDGAFDHKPNGLSCIIKYYDLNAKIIEGAFCGTVLDTLGNDLAITDGRFKVKLP